MIPDLQSQKDLRQLTVDKVGVKGIRYPIVVEDREHGVQHTVADLDIFVELPHYRRGTHMSRFIEVLNQYHRERLIGHLDGFLGKLIQVLKAEAAFVNISFPYFITKHAPVSGIASLLSYDCFFEASFREAYELWIGVKVPVTTLCPCSKEISQFGAHNQRSIITLKVQYREFIWLEELIDLAEKHASCEIWPLLKRPDEKYVTEKAYNNPKFVEDVVREIALVMNRDPRITHYQIESENFESIHNHSAYAMISKS